METATHEVKKVLSLREQLATRTDFRTKTVKLGDLGLEVTIRRATVGERKEIMSAGEDKSEDERNTLRGYEIIKRLCDPPISEEDLNELPAIVVDFLGSEIMKFNAWTKQGAAELVDQFPVKS